MSKETAWQMFRRLFVTPSKENYIYEGKEEDIKKLINKYIIEYSELEAIKMMQEVELEAEIIK